MVKSKAAPEFSTENVKAVANSLPKPQSKRRRELLPLVLREWSGAELRGYLSRESRAITKQRIKKLETVQMRSLELLDALKALDKLGRTTIVVAMMNAEGVRLQDVSRSEFTDRVARLDGQLYYLEKLAVIVPREIWKLAPGQPRNLTAYLVLQDAAAIFEWFTGIKAARGVDRINATETGPFFRFASVLWPIVFGNGTEGLPAAMKNWALGRSRYHERSALIANIALRQRTWGVFDE
ncbi:MAG TPA: hypothetical protein VH678_05755 [Xanthobacteraceae bacterium]